MIIDTNVYSTMATNPKRLGDALDRDTQVALPLPVLAELRAGFMGGTRQVENELVVSKFLAQDTTRLLMPGPGTTYLYAELQQYAKSQGRILSNNDIWIAALAREDGDVLITFDQDFSIFQELFGHKLKVLP